MVQRGEGTSFAIEACAPLLVNQPDGRQDLDRHIATEAAVMRSIHLAHPSGAEQGVDGKGADAATD
jgi:hypothetical protein